MSHIATDAFWALLAAVPLAAMLAPSALRDRTPAVGPDPSPRPSRFALADALEGAGASAGLVLAAGTTRRRFVQYGAAGAAWLASVSGVRAYAASGSDNELSDRIEACFEGSPRGAPFARDLVIPPVLDPVARTAEADLYEIAEFATTNEIIAGIRTPVWTYGGSMPGPTIMARAGRAVHVTFTNRLPPDGDPGGLIIVNPLDPEESPFIEPGTVTHLHGINADAVSDGYATDVRLPGDSLTHRYPTTRPAPRHAVVPRPSGPCHGPPRLPRHGGPLSPHGRVRGALPLPSGYGRYDIPLVIDDVMIDLPPEPAVRQLRPQGRVRRRHGRQRAPAAAAAGGQPPLPLSRAQRLRCPPVRAGARRRRHVPHDRLRPRPARRARAHRQPAPRRRRARRARRRLRPLPDRQPRRARQQARRARRSRAPDHGLRRRTRRDRRQPAARDAAAHRRPRAAQRQAALRAGAARRAVGRSTASPGIPAASTRSPSATPPRSGSSSRSPAAGVTRCTSTSGGSRSCRSRAGRAGPTKPAGKDTVWVGPNQTVRLVHEFKNFTGRFMFHCHNASHEDHTMMSQFEVVPGPPRDGPGVPTTPEPDGAPQQVPPPARSNTTPPPSEFPGLAQRAPDRPTARSPNPGPRARSPRARGGAAPAAAGASSARADRPRSYRVPPDSGHAPRQVRSRCVSSSTRPARSSSARASR